MTKIGEIFVEVSGDITQYQRDMARLRSDAKESGTAISNALNNSISTKQAVASITSLSANLTTLANVARTPAASFKATADSISVNLSDLAKKAGLSEREFARLNERMLRTQAWNNAQRSIQSVAKAAGLSAAEAQKLARQMGFTDAEAKKMTASMNRATRTGSDMRGEFAALGRTLVGIFGIYQIAQYGKEVINLADRYTLLRNQLGLVTGSTEELNRVQAELQKLAADTRVGFEPTLTIYTRMARATQELGVSSADLMTVTRALNESVILSGASAQEANAALIQLAQGMASGQLRGEELRSVMEQLPAVAMQIAKGMGVPYAEFRKMAEEGKITTEAMIDALKKQAGEIHTQFQDMEITVGQAWTNIGTNFGAVVDDMNRAINGTGSIAETMQGFADWLRDFHESGDATAWAEAIGQSGVSLASGLQLAFLDVSFQTDEVFEHIRYSWEMLMAGMQEKFAEYIRFVAEGYSKIPFIGEELSGAWLKVADSMQTTSAVAADHEKRMSALRGEYESNRQTIEEVALEMFMGGEETKKSGQKSEFAATKAKALGDASSDAAKKAKKAAEEHAKAIQSVIDKYLPVQKAVREYEEDERLLGEALRENKISMEDYNEAMDNLEVASKDAAFAQAGLTRALMDTGHEIGVEVPEQFETGMDLIAQNAERYAEKLPEEWEKGNEAVVKLQEDLVNDLGRIFEGYISDILTGEIDSIEELFSGLFDSIMDMFARLIAQMAANSLVDLLFGSGASGGPGLGTLFSGAGLLGDLFSGSGSGAGAGFGALGSLGSMYEWLTGSSIPGLGSLFGSTLPVAVAAPTALPAAPTAFMPGGPGSGMGMLGSGAGMGALAFGSVLAIGLGVALSSGLMSDSNVPPLSELLNAQGIGPEYFAEFVGEQFRTGLNPVGEGITSWMLDAESMILSKSDQLSRNWHTSMDRMSDASMAYFNQATGAWQSLDTQVYQFNMLSQMMGEEAAAAMIEARTGLVGLGEELIQVSRAQKQHYDMTEQEMREMGVITDDLIDELNGMGSSFADIASGASALENSMGGIGSNLDGLSDAMGSLSSSASDTRSDIDALSLAIRGLTPDGGNPPLPIPQPQPTGPDDLPTINVHVTVQGNEIIDTKKLKSVMTVVADQAIVARDRRPNMVGRRVY